MVIGNTARLFAVPNAELPLLMLPKPGFVMLEALPVCLCELPLAMRPGYLCCVGAPGEGAVVSAGRK